MDTPQLPAPQDHAGTGSDQGDIKRPAETKILYNIVDSPNTTIIIGNNNNINMGTAGGRADEMTRPRPESDRPAATEAETVETEIIHPAPQRERAQTRAEEHPQEAQDETINTGQDAAGSERASPPTDEQRVAAASTTTTQQQWAATRGGSKWKKVAAIGGLAAVPFGLYMMFKSGTTTPTPIVPPGGKPVVTETNKEPPAPEPVVHYAELKVKPLPDMKVSRELLRIKLSFKDKTDINTAATSCPDPWIFKANGTPMLCVPLPYFDESFPGKPLDTPEKRQALFAGAAEYKGSKFSPTGGRYYDGNQILIPLDMLSDPSFPADFQATLPALLKKAEDRKPAKLSFVFYHKKGADKYGCQFHVEPLSLEELAKPVPEV